MKRLISLVAAVLLAIGMVIPSVSAAESPVDAKQEDFNEVRAVADRFADVIGLNDNDTQRVEAREIVPAVIIGQVLTNKYAKYSDSKIPGGALDYIAVMRSGDTPVRLFSVNETDVRQSYSTGITDFTDALERITAHTASDNIYLIVYNTADIYLCAETAEGAFVTPAFAVSDIPDMVTDRYTDDLIIPFADFELAYNGLLDAQYATPAQPLSDPSVMGGSLIMQHLPAAKLQRTIEKAVTIGAAVSSVSAAESPVDAKQEDFDEVRADMMQFLHDISTYDPGEPADGYGSKFEVREVVPTMFVQQLQKSVYVPENVPRDSMHYTSIVFRRGRPIMMISRDKAFLLNISTDGVSDFVDAFGRIGAHSVNGDIYVIKYSDIDSYLCTETTQGTVVMPLVDCTNAPALVKRQYTDEMLIPLADFVSAYEAYLQLLGTTPAQPLSDPHLMGGSMIMQHLPAAKLQRTIEKALTIGAAIAIGIACCVVLCVTLERQRTASV